MRLPALAVAVASMMISSPAWAQAMGISPVRVEMTGGEQSAIITVRNTGASPINLQVRAMDWSQVDGVESFSLAGTLIASPPMSTLAPGEEQIVRLFLDEPAKRTSEKAFRLILDEIPLGEPTPGAGMRIRLRALVPVFVAPKGVLRPDIQWSARRSAAGLLLTAVNTGARRNRLLNLNVAVGGTPIAVPSSNSGYVLSGGSQSWTVPDVPLTAATVTITADGDFGEVNADAPILP